MNPKNDTEKQIEQQLTKAVKNAGGISLKWTSPNRRGVPDRIIMLPRGKIAFIELKAPNGRLSPHQKIHQRLITQLGQKYYVINHRNQIEAIINEIQTA